MATWFGRLKQFVTGGASYLLPSARPGPAPFETLERRQLLSAASAATSANTINFTASQRFEQVCAFNGYIATGSFTNNGLTDFATTRGSENAIFTFTNNGNGTFTQGQTYHVNEARGIIAGDFNHDGNTDLAVVAENNNSNSGSTASNGNLYVLYGQGNGTFSTPVKIARTRQGFGALTEGDFNGDGLPDLAVTNNRAVSVYINQGNGTFATAIRYNTGIVGNAAYLSAEDLNGDGVTDLVVGKGLNPYISVLMGQSIGGKATGVFGPPATYRTHNLPISVAVGDFNHDGRPDIVVGNNGFRQGVGVLMNNGDGTFSPQVTYQAGNFVRYVTTGDFFGNGQTDIAATDFTGPLSIFPSNGDGTFSTPQKYSAGRQGDFLAQISLGTGGESLLVSHSGAVTVLVNNTTTGPI